MYSAASTYRRSSRSRRSSSRSVQSSGSESTISWNWSARPIAAKPTWLTRRSDEQGLVEQERVERDDQRRHDDRQGSRGAPIHQRAHDVAASGEQHERDEREGNAE